MSNKNLDERLTADDRVEIQELANRYSCAMDCNDMDAWISTWAPDGVWIGGVGTYRGTDELLQLLPDLGARVQGKRHIITNHVVSGTQSMAKLECYLLVVEAKVGGSSTVTGTYADELVKVDGRWVFSKRVMKLDV